MRKDAPEFVPGGAAAESSNSYPNAWAAGSFFPPMNYQMMAAMASASAAGAGLNRYNGRIKSFNDEKGFGFIESPQAFAQYGRDVFLHKTAKGDLKVGADVTFTMEVNKQGMPQAKDVRSTGTGKGADKGKRQKGGKGKGKSGKDGKDDDASEKKDSSAQDAST